MTCRKEDVQTGADLPARLPAKYWRCPYMVLERVDHERLRQSGLLPASPPLMTASPRDGRRRGATELQLTDKGPTGVAGNISDRIKIARLR